jgi:hypothetical protein
MVLQPPVKPKITFTEKYPKCTKLAPLGWFMFSIYIIMCICYDLYYCMQHSHMAGMIWLYTCGSLCACIFSYVGCSNFYSPVFGEDEGPNDHPTWLWVYIVWGTICFFGKITSIIIFTLNEEGKIDIGMSPDSFVISVINWLVSFSIGLGPTAFLLASFIICCPCMMCFPDMMFMMGGKEGRYKMYNYEEQKRLYEQSLRRKNDLIYDWENDSRPSVYDERPVRYTSDYLNTIESSPESVVVESSV